jgi:CarD family transcriptional regulator
VTKFDVGDRVVYPSQGAGTITERVTREVLGETHEYLRIVFARGNLDVLVPLTRSLEVGLRHTIEPDEVERLFDTIERADLKLPAQWPPRYRAEQEIIARGSAYELARLVGVLARRDVEKGLATTEREVYDAARALLASELSVVTAVALTDAEARLSAVIEERTRHA